MLMRTRDYRAIRIKPDFAPLEQIFDQKIVIFFGKMIFWFFDKSAGLADINEKFNGKLCITYFDLNP